MSGIKIDLDDFESSFDYWNKPLWEYTTKVHDWKNYISEDMQVIWSTFTDLQKYLIYKQAEEQASDEDWD